MKNFIKYSLLLFAIFSFSINSEISLASGTQGTYVEFKITSDKVNGLIKIYSLNGNTRAETNIQIPGMSGNGTKMIMITRKDSADIVYMLNESSKTYTEMNTKDAKSKTEGDEYEVTVLGNEKVNNYNCLHVRVVDKTKNTNMEMWTSKDVMDYSFLKNLKSQYMASKNILNALASKGADGFIVRMITMKNDKIIQMDLVTAEKKDIDMSMFSLDGYTKSASPNLLDTQKMMQDMQKMTPEERKAYIDKLKEQYKQ